MSSSPNDSITITGEVCQVRVYREDTGWGVVDLELDDIWSQYPNILVGVMPGVCTGLAVEVSGKIVNHERFGRQLLVSNYHASIPRKNFARYLDTMIAGIGPQLAAKIVATFGDEAQEVFEKSPERLLKVPGIGPQSLEIIKQSWNEQNAQRATILALQEYEVTPAMAMKLIKQYGDQTLATIEENPYVIAKDVWGVGFLKADKIALKAGIAPDSINRAAAAVLYVMEKGVAAGHTILRVYEVVEACQDLLGDQVPEGLIKAAIDKCVSDCDCIFSPVPAADGAGEIEGICLRWLWKSENVVAENIARLQNNQTVVLRQLVGLDLSKEVEAIIKERDILISDDQVLAVIRGLQEKISLICGGAGVGKTSTLRALVALAEKYNVRVVLAAPTGKAAKRMEEATGHESSTIHRMLGSDAEGNFYHDAEDPLEYDLVIIDETSMLDAHLAASLLKAVPDGAHIVFCGDPNQLPSVGPGNVLGDILQSGEIAATVLTKIHRQDGASLIVGNAHKILQGQMPDLSQNDDNFFFFPIVDRDWSSAVENIISLITSRLPNSPNPQYRFTQDDIQVISPVHRTDLGGKELNKRLQAALNPPEFGNAQLVLSSRTLRVGDRVMQIKNSRAKKVYNGDMGSIASIETVTGKVYVNFDVGLVEYEKTDLDQLVHSYCVTVHKCQGSESPVVILVLTKQMYQLLTRKVLYTGITRAKKLLVLIAEPGAIQVGVSQNRDIRRSTRLLDLIVSGTPAADPTPGHRTQNNARTPLPVQIDFFG